MSTVRRRCVFYVSGFDPKGAAYYHRLYREQAALQARVNGMAIEVGPRQRQAGGNPFWELKAQTAAGPVETHYEFMQWDDIVRAHWPGNLLRLWWQIVATTGVYLRTGALWKMYKLSWPIAVAAFVPFLLVCAIVLLLPAAGLLAGWLILEATGRGSAAAAAGGATALALAWIARRLEARYSLYWMMRSYAFTARQAQGRLPELEARFDEQALRLLARVEQGGYDEVLVVGHSSGAIMAAAILARALRRSPQLGSGAGQALSLLTLGQCIPLLALLPAAVGFRRELELLGSTQQLDWIDFSAPPDGCCFALVDPLASCGLPPVPDRPKLLSPRFAEMFSPVDYRKLRDHKLKMHFQYLSASTHATAYDYF